jgi:hypothetical protein
VNKPRAWLTPSATLPLGTACYTIAVPDDEGFRRILVGALSLLTNPENYEQFGTLTPQQASDEFRKTLQSFIFRESDCSMIGAIIPYVTPQIPQNLLPCDGSVYTRDEYSKLYTALITTNLIINSDTFQTPSLEGMFLRGDDATNAQNGNGGSDTKIIGINNLPPHTHDYYSVVFNVDVESVGVPDPVGAGLDPFPKQTSSVGDGEALDIKPRYYTVKYGIVCR